MSKKLYLWVALVAFISLGVVFFVKAQGTERSAAGAPRYECAMIKWDGPDKVALIYPDHSEIVRVFKTTKLPSDMTEEEFCLTWGANKMAQSGWEPVNLNSRRVLFRRTIGH